MDSHAVDRSDLHRAGAERYGTATPQTSRDGPASQSHVRVRR
jgi:hypothetical protein